MCGITGIVSYQPDRDASARQQVQEMSAAMANRGPDASGEWSSSEGRVHLGHRRLSILDLSSAGNQPMVDEASGCVVVFNGEIYNFRILKARLKAAGFSFRSESDTEVLLKGYLLWGEALLEHLRGMFAFALWDPRKQALWLARDPYGIKPLYYMDNPERFTFASQVRPLRDHAGANTAPDPAGLVGFMLMGSVPEPYTCYTGVRALPAGHSVWVSGEGLGPMRAFASVAQVWREAAESPVTLGEAELNAKVRHAVADSVIAHQVSDVPVGAFLSAGIDSSALVGLMAEGRAEGLHTLTLGFRSFQGTLDDETVLAQEVATRYGCDHRNIWVEDKEAAADWPRALAAMDQPSIDGFNTWLVSKHAAAQGLKVVVSGVGGDELFGGYDHFRQIPIWQQRLRKLGSVPGLLPLLGAGARVASRYGLVHAKAAGLARFGRDLAGLYLVRRGLFMPWELPKILDGDLLRDGLAQLSPPHFLSSAIGGMPAVDYAAIASLESAFYLRNQLLRDSDLASMAHSLELRTPLVDYHLLQELASHLVVRPNGAEGKRPLARAPRLTLPEAVLNRKKSGFSLPMARWVQQSEAIAQWRRNKHLQKTNTPWARRLAYSLIAHEFPEAVTR